MISQGYNALGQVISQTVPYFGAAAGVYQPLAAAGWAGKTTQTAYDALGRVTRVTPPDGSWVDTVYHGRRRAVLGEAVSGTSGHQTIRETDAFGRLVSVKQYTGVYPKNPPAPNWNAAVEFQATYEYNVTDQLEQVTGSDGAVSDPGYDRLGRKVSLSDADMGAWQYRYDAAGNLVKQRDGRNWAICFTYDGHNRLVGKTYHPNTPNLDNLTCPGTGHTVTYGYDLGANGLGRRTSLTDPSGATSWTYDARGRVTSERKTIGAHTFVTGHSYRSDDAPATLTYPDGEVVAYGYDGRGLLTTLSGAQASWGGTSAANYVSAATYTALGQPLSRVYSNTLTLAYGYHSTSYRLTTLTAPGVSLSYGYYANGNVQTITDTGQTTTFTYDDLDRLKTASGGYTASYSYQPNGNLTVKTEGGVIVNLSYGAGKHAPNSVNSQAYTPDPNGNLEARPGQTFGYDAENRLTQIVSGTITTTFTYDGDGNLVKKVAPEGTTLYVGAHYEVRPLPASPLPIPQPPPTLPKRIFLPLVANDALFVDGRPAQPVKYYLLNGQRIASRAGSAGTVTYYYHDHLGSTVASSSGESTRYWPYGATRNGSIGTAYQFTGQRREAALGLYFFQARWYDGAVGRFLQPDTIVPNPGDPQSLNRYSYASNNPVRYVDSNGHCGPLTPVCLALLLGGMALLLQGDSPDLNVTPEDVASQRLGGALFVGGAGLTVGAGAAGLGTQAATAACADGDCTNEVRGAGQVVQGATQATQSVWQLDPLKRGQEIERMLGRSPQLTQNFPVIDRFENGVATSIKSMDLGAKSYQNVGTLTSTVKGYVSELANWRGTTWAGTQIDANQITARELLLAIPQNATQVQLSALRQLQQWAMTVGVTVNVTVIP